MGLHVASHGLTTRGAAAEALTEWTAQLAAAGSLMTAASLVQCQRGNLAGGIGFQSAWEATLGADTGGQQETGCLRCGRHESTASNGWGEVLAPVSSLIVRRP